MVNKSLKNCRDWAAEFRKWSGPHDRSELQESQYMMVVLDDEIERLSTEGAELRLHLSRVVDAYFSDTGAEPSVSVLGRAADEALAYLDCSLRCQAWGSREAYLGSLEDDDASV